MLTLRAVLLYLFAVSTALPALIAWDDDLGHSPVGVVLWALGFAASLGLGLRLESAFSSIEEKRRKLLAGFLGTLQMSVLVLALALATVLPSAGLLGFLASFLSTYFLVVLGLVAIAPHPRAVLAHGLGLAAIACLRGGATGAVAAVAAFTSAALFVGVDHHARILTAYRVDLDRHAERAFGRVLAVTLPVAAVLGLVLSFAPDAMPMGQSVALAKRGDVALSREAFRGIVLSGLLGAGAIYAAGRFVNRTKRKQRRSMEVSEPFRGQPERIEKPAPPPLPRRAAGRRGRIIHAYLTLLEALSRIGFSREGSETPAEFATALGEPRRPLETLTSLFSAARWGPSEPREEDVVRAESASSEIAAATSRRPPRRRSSAIVP